MLKVIGNDQLFGPFYIQLKPVISTYAGINFQNFKNRLKTNTGYYRRARPLFDSMHRFSKFEAEKGLAVYAEKRYCPFIFYFEFQPGSENKFVALKCDFPRIFQDEDVQIFERMDFDYTFQRNESMFGI